MMKAIKLYESIFDDEKSVYSGQKPLFLIVTFICKSNWHLFP